MAGTDRRTFIKQSAVAGGALGLGALGCSEGAPVGADAGATMAPAGATTTGVTRADRVLRVLVLGGTGFIGPHTIRYALDRGHTVTMFNRGRTNPELFPEVERLVGDRNDDLESLRGRDWDVVLDLPATNPQWVKDSAELLADHAELYVHISTLSVYSDNSIIGLDEATGPTFRREDVDLPEDGRLPYGLAKTLAEEEARVAFGGRALIIRPGLIVGPGDPTDRFTYWPVRVDRGGEVLAPGDGTDQAQIIDARDLMAFTVDMAERNMVGTYNAVGPESPLSMIEMLAGCRAVTTGPCSFTWVTPQFLAEQGVRGWSDMPVWVPPAPEMAGFSAFSNTKAVAAGLTFRPLADTARDTIEWHATRPVEQRENMRSGVSAEREAELLEAWHSRSA